MIALCVLFFIATILFGIVIMLRFPVVLPPYARIIGVFLTGYVAATTVGYIGAVVVGLHTSNPMTIGVVSACVISVLLTLFIRLSYRDLRAFFDATLGDWIFILITAVISWWMMTKTFGSNGSGTVYFGSNVVYDMAQNFGIIRSFSWGSHVPFLSPFVVGTVYPYHFLFYFGVAMYEYLGIPIAYAMNVPSSLGMMGLFIGVATLTSVLMPGRRMLAYIAGITTVVWNPSLAWIMYIVTHGVSLATFRSIWTMQTYPYSHPYDSSIISIFWTLDTYVNQRHFTFAAGLFFLILSSIIIMLRQVQRNIQCEYLWCVSILVGLLPFWHVTVFLALFFIISAELAVHRLWRELRHFILIAGILGGIQLIMMYGSTGGNLHNAESMAFHLWLSSYRVVDLLWYIFLNFGILPIVTIVTFIRSSRSLRVILVPLGMLAIAPFLPLPIEVSHVWVTLLMVSAIPLSLVFARELMHDRLEMRIIAGCVIVFLVGSGFFHLPIIRNEFRYPAIGNTVLPFVQWIEHTTKRDSIFISPPDMVDPVVFAGRATYLGWYRADAYRQKRLPVVEAAYAPRTVKDRELVASVGIDYIVDSPSHPYTGIDRDQAAMDATYRRVYTDEIYRVYAVNPMR